MEDFVLKYDGQEVQDILDGAKAMAGKIGVDGVALFDAGKDYVAGDVVVYEEKIYKFVQNHSDAWLFADVVDWDLLSQIKAEKEARQQAIEAEAQARQDADENLQKAIDAEAQVRRTADENLQLAIYAETQERRAADENLQAAINAEAEARQDADDAEAQARQDADEAEAQARRTADENLQKAIEAEVEVREIAYLGDLGDFVGIEAVGFVDSLVTSIGKLGKGLGKYSFNIGGGGTGSKQFVTLAKVGSLTKLTIEGCLKAEVLNGDGLIDSVTSTVSTVVECDVTKKVWSYVYAVVDDTYLPEMLDEASVDEEAVQRSNKVMSKEQTLGVIGEVKKEVVYELSELGSKVNVIIEDSSYDSFLNSANVVTGVADIVVYRDNSYIDNNGKIKEEEGYHIYGPYDLEKGKIVKFKGYGSSSASIAVIENGIIIPIAFYGSVWNDRGDEYCYLAGKNRSVLIVTGGNYTPTIYFQKRYSIPNLLNTPSVKCDINTEINGYIDKDGNVITGGNYSITPPISISAGEVVMPFFEASGVAVVSRYMNGVYLPIIYGSQNNMYWGFLAEEDMEIVLCCKTKNVDYTPQYGVLKVGDTVLTNTMFESKFNEKIQKEYDRFDVELTEYIGIGTDKAYIDKYGTFVEYANYAISKEIVLKEGDVLSFAIVANDVSVLSKIKEGKYEVLIDSLATKDEQSFVYTASEDCIVVISGDRTYIKDGLKYVVNKSLSVKNTVMDMVKKPDFYLINPYAGVSFDNPVCAQSHEHCYEKGMLEKSYKRGIRVISCSHYRPSTPRYPLSNFDYTYQDYKSTDAVVNGDLEMVIRHEAGSIPYLEVDGATINTDDIPQIANAERVSLKDVGGHFNILGLLWGSAGHWLCNKELATSETSFKRKYSLESTDKFNELLKDETMWQFGSKYAFGTVNHNTSSSVVVDILDKCPSIFKAMELFNQGYSNGWNQQFRDAYDEVLRKGKRLWGTAVVDWQSDWATWNFTTDEEKAEWETKYEALSAEEQATYGSAENYYMSKGRYKFDRGTNVLLMNALYEKMTPEQKAKEAIKSYIAGRYYMSGKNTHTMTLTTNSKNVVFTVDDYADKIVIVTATRRIEYTDVNSVNLVAKEDDIFIRFEAYWNDGEFIFTNPIWVEKES